MANEFKTDALRSVYHALPRNVKNIVWSMYWADAFEHLDPGCYDPCQNDEHIADMAARSGRGGPWKMWLSKYRSNKAWAASVDAAMAAMYTADQEE